MPTSDTPTDADRKAADECFFDSATFTQRVGVMNARLDAIAAHFARHRTNAVRLAVEAERARWSELLNIAKRLDDWLDGWCPHGCCCAESAKELHERLGGELKRINRATHPTPTT
jgi:hypothetical protein